MKDSIQIIDFTLAALRETASPKARDMEEWRVLMRELGIRRVEDGAESPVADGGRRVFVRHVPSAAPASAGELFAAPLSDGVPLRLYGLDDAMPHWDLQLLFAGLRVSFPILEPGFGNRLGCATALGLEWLEQGGDCLVCSLAGVGNLPPLEEVLMALHLCGLRPCDHLFVLADLRRLFQTMGGGEVPDNKAVIGPGIFAVESGIHVDGLGKDPLLYEPFPPESVGAKRRIVMGPYSGRGSVRVKCVQLGLPCAPELVSKLLAQVRSLSLSLERALEDQEFITLHRQIYANRGATAAAG